MQDVSEKSKQAARRFAHTVRAFAAPHTAIGTALRARRIDAHRVSMGDHVIVTDGDGLHTVVHHNRTVCAGLHWFHSATAVVEAAVVGRAHLIPGIIKLDRRLCALHMDLRHLNHVIANCSSDRRAALCPRRHWIAQCAAHCEDQIRRASVVPKPTNLDK